MLFDTLVGVIVPALCLIFDPLVFKGTWTEAPLLGRFRLTAYLFIATQCTVLISWRILQPRSPRTCAVYSGLLLAGTIGAFGLGVALLPFSIVGLPFLGLGALGFTPFLTSHVFRRNYREAHERAAPVNAPRWRFSALACVAAFVVPAAAATSTTVWTKHAFVKIASADVRRQSIGLAMLRCVSPLIDARDFISAYDASRDASRKARIAGAFHIVKGGDLEAEIDRIED